jgi:hypothetical protein
MALQTTTEMQPADYWLSFVGEWDRLARVAHDTGQTEMEHFFDELADDAGDMWAHFTGGLSL